MAKRKHILLGIAGSIAAVKAPAMLRLFVDAGYDVDCVLTSLAEKFVTPLSLSTLLGKKVYTQMFDEEAYLMPHLDLARKTDLMVVAPATVTVLGRMARGLGDDMVALTYLTTTAPTLVAPAMHDTMWLHPACQKNVEILKNRGVKFVGPVAGKLADKTKALGRMSDPDDILKSVKKILSK